MQWFCIVILYKSVKYDTIIFYYIKEALTCIKLTISTLLKKIKLDKVDSMLSSNTEGVGKTTSWIYCTR